MDEGEEEGGSEEFRVEVSNVGSLTGKPQTWSTWWKEERWRCVQETRWTESKGDRLEADSRSLVMEWMECQVLEVSDPVCRRSGTWLNRRSNKPDDLTTEKQTLQYTEDNYLKWRQPCIRTWNWCDCQQQQPSCDALVKFKGGCRREEDVSVDEQTLRRSLCRSEVYDRIQRDELKFGSGSLDDREENWSYSGQIWKRCRVTVNLHSIFLH